MTGAALITRKSAAGETSQWQPQQRQLLQKMASFQHSFVPVRSWFSISQLWVDAASPRLFSQDCATSSRISRPLVRLSSQDDEGLLCLFCGRTAGEHIQGGGDADASKLSFTTSNKRLEDNAIVEVPPLSFPPHRSTPPHTTPHLALRRRRTTGTPSKKSSSG